MDSLGLTLGALLVVALVVSVSLWKALTELIWRPHAITEAFRKQGVTGPPYKFLKGSFDEFKSIQRVTKDLVLDNNSHDITVRVVPHFREWTKQYGRTFLFWFGAKPRICITEPEMIKEVLSNKLGLYQMIEVTPAFYALLGKGLNLLDGEDWARHRRILTPAFAMDKIKMMTKEMTERAKVMLEGWLDQVILEEDQQKEIEVDEKFQELTATVIAYTAFGSSYKEGMKVFLAQKELQTIIVETAFKRPEYLPTRRTLHKGELERRVRNKLMDIIQCRLDSEDRIHGNDLLGLMIEAYRKEGSEMLRMDEIIDECKTFFFTGFETTSLLLSWAMFLLSTNQDWQEKLREEVLQECAMEVPSVDAISKLKLVTMVLLETLRLYSPIFFIGKKSCKDITLGNLRIPKGTGVVIPIPVIHRIEELWGADANKFNPNRFQNGVLKAGRHPNAMLAFSAGPKSCIGQNLAMLEAKIVIAMILQRFSFSLSPNYKHVPETYVTLRPKYGVPIVFKPL